MYTLEPKNSDVYLESCIYSVQLVKRSLASLPVQGNVVETVGSGVSPVVVPDQAETTRPKLNNF